MKLLRLPTLGDLLDDALVALRRFPLPACAAFGATMTGLAEVEKFSLFATLLGNGTLFSFFVLAFFGTLLAKLIAERSGATEPYIGGIRGLVIAVVLLALAVLVAASGPAGGRSFEPNVSALFLLAGLILSLMAVPYSGGAAFWNFNRTALTGCAFGFAVAVILGLGLNAVLLALDTLFGLTPPRELWREIWVICMCLIWPWRALASIPPNFESPDADYCPAWISFLARYVFVPLASVYLVILYAFAVKILIFWDLPRGQIAWLVCVFALIGVATKLIVYPLRETGHKLLRLYDRILFPALFVPAILLAAAVAVRILDYGVTEERYLLVLLTVWLFTLACFFSFSGKRLFVAPLSLGVLLIIASIGPWGAVDYSARDQLARLEPLLRANKLLVDDRLTPVTSVPFAADKEISSILRYLSVPHRRRIFDAWLDGRDSALELKPDWRAHHLAKALGLQFIGRWQRHPRFFYRLASNEPLDIAGYDLMAERRNIRPGTPWEIAASASPDRYTVALQDKSNTLSITDRDGARLSFDLTAVVRQADAQKRKPPDVIKDRSVMTRDAAQDGFRVRLIVKTIAGTLDGDKMKFSSLGAVILIKRR